MNAAMPTHHSCGMTTPAVTLAWLPSSANMNKLHQGAILCQHSTNTGTQQLALAERPFLQSQLTTTGCFTELVWILPLR